MHYRIPYALAGLAVFTPMVAAAPFKYPLENKFPETDDLANIALGKAAGGNWSNGKLATKLDDDILTSFKLIAFNELAEVAFFTDLVKNITSNAKGYEVGDSKEKEFALTALNRIVAQEELHALNANRVLKSAGAEEIKPCEYHFGVESYSSAIALANTFTDVVLGTLGDVQALAATAAGKDAAPVIRGVASSLGQEGQQDGWFRSVLGKAPSAEPFLTPGARDFTFTALQDFIVPGSCPKEQKIDLKVFEKLTMTSKVEDLKKDAPVAFEATCKPGMEMFDEKAMKVVFINGATLPAIKDIKDVKKDGETYAFTAELPDNVDVMAGLTYAVVVKGEGPFTTAEDVAKETVFGPILIETEVSVEKEITPPMYGQVTPPTYKMPGKETATKPEEKKAKVPAKKEELTGYQPAADKKILPATN